MRARNREINIFNMSLLDILTGMLGAFLFLMLGLLPYYAKVSKQNPEEVKQLKAENKSLHEQVDLQQQQIADLQKQLEELQKLVKQTGGGPMTAEQIQQLMDELNQMRQQLDQLRTQLQQAQDQVQQLQAQNKQLQAQLDQAQQLAQQAQQLQQQVQQLQQQVDQTNKERSFWESQLPTLSIISSWNSEATDIDVFVITPKGEIFGQKTGKLLGKDVTVDGCDSHVAGSATSNEGLLVYMYDPGDYLVFYRVPANAAPATYSNLTAFYILHAVGEMEKQEAYIREDALPLSHSDAASPGGLYGWCVLHYDDQQHNISRKPLPDKLPAGILLPGSNPSGTPAGFPFSTPVPPLSHQH